MPCLLSCVERYARVGGQRRIVDAVDASLISCTLSLAAWCVLFGPLGVHLAMHLELGSGEQRQLLSLQSTFLRLAASAPLHGRCDEWDWVQQIAKWNALVLMSQMPFKSAAVAHSGPQPAAVAAAATTSAGTSSASSSESSSVDNRRHSSLAHQVPQWQAAAVAAGRDILIAAPNIVLLGRCCLHYVAMLQQHYPESFAAGLTGGTHLVSDSAAAVSPQDSTLSTAATGGGVASPDAANSASASASIESNEEELTATKAWLLGATPGEET